MKYLELFITNSIFTISHQVSSLSTLVKIQVMLWPEAEKNSQLNQSEWCKAAAIPVPKAATTSHHKDTLHYQKAINIYSHFTPEYTWHKLTDKEP